MTDERLAAIEEISDRMVAALRTERDALRDRLREAERERDECLSLQRKTWGAVGDAIRAPDG